MRILKFACILAALLFSTTVMADVIGPHGESSPGNHFHPWDWERLKVRSVYVDLSVDKMPPASALMLVGEDGRIADEVRCDGNGPCRITIKETGDLYLVPKAPKGPVVIALKGPGINVKSLLSAHKLYFLKTFKIGNGPRSKSLSCYLEEKGHSYVMQCRP